MLHKIGIAMTFAILGFRWVMSQVSTVTDLKDFIDAGFTVVSLWVFLFYLIQREKVRDVRADKKDQHHREEIAHYRATISSKDDEIRRLNDKK